MGPSWERPLPHILCCSFSKVPVLTDSHMLQNFSENSNSDGRKLNHTWWSEACSAQIYMAPWRIDTNLCDTSPSANQRIVHELFTTMWLPHLVFKNALLKPFAEFEVLGDMSHCHLTCPCNKPLFSTPLRCFGLFDLNGVVHSKLNLSLGTKIFKTNKVWETVIAKISRRHVKTEKNSR